MSNRTIKLMPYSKEQFPQAKFINGIPIEDAVKKYQIINVFTDEEGKPTRVEEDYFIDEQGNHLRPKELTEVVISAPARLSDEGFRQYLLNSQNFNRRYGLPVDYDNIPWFTYNGITGKRNVNKNTYERYIAADNKSREFNKQMDTLVVGATGIMLSPYLLGSAALAAPSIAPGTAAGNFIGESAGAVAGIEASNLASKKLTGKTVEQHINNGLGIDNNSFAGQWITPMLNPAGYATMVTRPIINAGNTAITNFADNLAKQYIKQTNPGLITRAQESLKNQLTRFNQIPETVKSQIKINSFQERPKLISKSQYRVNNNIKSSSADEPRYNGDLDYIEIPYEEIEKRANNLKNSIDIYKKRLNNGGIKLVYNRGTERYKVGDIKVAQSEKDIEDAINKLLVQDAKDHPIPKVAYDYGIQDYISSVRSVVLKEGATRDQAEAGVLDFIKNNFKALEHASDDELQKLMSYVFSPPSSSNLHQRIQNWGQVQNIAPKELGFTSGNFVWAPNKETTKEILKNTNLDGYDKIQWANNSQFILPHEFEHAFQNAHEVYKKYYQPKYLIPFDEFYSENIDPKRLKQMVYEMDNLIGFKPQGINQDYISNPTELLARGTQIKNWLGITDPLQQLTAKDLKEAAAYYLVKSPDNNMTEFFNAITDWDKAAKFLSYATAAAGVGSTVGLNNKKLIEKPNK